MADTCPAKKSLDGIQGEVDPRPVIQGHTRTRAQVCELGDGGVCELRGATSQEGRGRSNFLLEEAVVSSLFALLTDNRSQDGNRRRLVAAVSGKDGLLNRQNSEDNVGKGLGKSYSIIEIVDREVVLAGLDCGVFCVGENSVGSEDVDLFQLY
jgi:hypothetical protein